MRISYLNGSFISSDELNIPLLDRGVLFGEGVFTTLRLHEGFVENISRHLFRLEEHCQAIGFQPPAIDRTVFRELAARNQAGTGTWRLKVIATKGGGRVAGSLAILLERYEPISKAPYRLALYPTPVCKPTAHLKTLAYLDRHMIKAYGDKRGCDEVLTTGVDGNLLEGAFSNLFWVVGNTLMTPSFSLPLLKGTYLSSLIEGALKIGFKIIETESLFDEIERKANVFVCNSMIGLQAVAQIEAWTFKRDLKVETTLQGLAWQVISTDLLDIRDQLNSSR